MMTAEVIPMARVAAGTIEIRHLSKTFGKPGVDGVVALRDIDCAIDKGSFVSVVGPSGCGKSTLLRIVAGLVAPDAGGVVEVLGRPHHGVPEDVGVVFQTHNMLPW